jgi:hypothetical protein
MSLGLSYGGFSFSDSWTLGTYASFGPNFPHGASDPAFGSQWHGCSNGNYDDYEGVPSANVVHLGAGQSPYNALVVQVNDYLSTCPE